jgi:hypothetical protein
MTSGTRKSKLMTILTEGKPMKVIKALPVNGGLWKYQIGKHTLMKETICNPYNLAKKIAQKYDGATIKII